MAHVSLHFCLRASIARRSTHDGDGGGDQKLILFFSSRAPRTRFPRGANESIRIRRIALTLDDDDAGDKNVENIRLRRGKLVIRRHRGVAPHPHTRVDRFVRAAT